VDVGSHAVIGHAGHAGRGVIDGDAVGGGARLQADAVGGPYRHVVDLDRKSGVEGKSVGRGADGGGGENEEFVAAGGGADFPLIAGDAALGVGEDAGPVGLQRGGGGLEVDVSRRAVIGHPGDRGRGVVDGDAVGSRGRLPAGAVGGPYRHVVD